MSYRSTLLKGGCIGIVYGTAIGLITGDTRSLDNGSFSIFFISQGPDPS